MKSAISGIAFLLATSVLLPATVPALAQNAAVIKERQNAMKAVGRAARTAGQMVKGEVPFDAAKAAEVFAAMKATSAKYGTLFPEDSKTGEETEAAPAIWEKPAEFQAAVVKFDTDITAAIAADPQDLGAFKASFATVAQNCRNCHQEFRVDK